MTIAQEAEALKKQFEEAKDQIKMMSAQIDDLQHALQDWENGGSSKMTEYQQAVYKMFEAFVGEKK